MPLTFDACTKLFKDDKIGELAERPEGIRFLKLRSLNRKEALEHLFTLSAHAGIEGNSATKFRAAYESNIESAQIETCIRNIYQAERLVRRAQEPELINQLYRLQEFNWGGLHQNSLEKTIVDNYVKKIRDYDSLNEAIEQNLYASLRGYVLCSWYNHWTSIMIEDVFKDHTCVLPAVGLVKKIDFFIGDTPFDLKVTYLPEEYLALKRSGVGLRPELTVLKQTARCSGIPIPADIRGSALLQDLWTKVADSPDASCLNAVSELQGFRDALVTSIRNDPAELIKWLYENQGVRRFDASNRLFLVLIDQRNYFESWKLKRARPLLEAQVGSYLDGICEGIGRRIEFNWEGDTYNAVADLILVTNPVARA